MLAVPRYFFDEATKSCLYRSRLIHKSSWLAVDDRKDVFYAANPRPAPARAADFTKGYGKHLAPSSGGRIRFGRNSLRGRRRSDRNAPNYLLEGM